MSYIIRPGRRKKQIINNLIADIIIHEKVSINCSYVKFFIKIISKLINFAKRGDLHSRRLSLKYLHSFKDLNVSTLNDEKNGENITVVNKLFNVLGNKYKNRNGGYVRTFHIGKRRGDSSKLILISLV